MGIIILVIGIAIGGIAGRLLEYDLDSWYQSTVANVLQSFLVIAMFFIAVLFIIIGLWAMGAELQWKLI